MYIMENIKLVKDVNYEIKYAEALKKICLVALRQDIEEPIYISTNELQNCIDKVLAEENAEELKEKVFKFYQINTVENLIKALEGLAYENINLIALDRKIINQVSNNLKLIDYKEKIRKIEQECEEYRDLLIEKRTARLLRSESKRYFERVDVFEEKYREKLDELEKLLKEMNEKMQDVI